MTKERDSSNLKDSGISVRARRWVGARIGDIFTLSVGKQAG